MNNILNLDNLFRDHAKIITMETELCTAWALTRDIISSNHFQTFGSRDITRKFQSLQTYIPTTVYENTLAQNKSDLL